MIRLIRSRLRGLRLRRAGRFAAAGRFAEAEATLSRLAARFPDDLEVQVAHAFLAHDTARHAAALARWDAVRARWPDHAFAWSGSAANARELGRLAEARDIIEEALRRFPEDLIAMSEAMRIYDRLAAPRRSLELAGAMARLQPEHEGWRSQLFDRLLAAGLVEDAAAQVEPASPGAAGEAAAALRRTRLALRRGDGAEADRLLRSLAQPGADRSAVDAMHRVATDLMLHHPRESLAFWRHLTPLLAGNATVRHHHVDALIRCGDYAEAAARARTALRDHPEDHDLLFDLALVAYKTDRWQEAIDGFEHLLGRRPDHERARLFLSRARMDRDMAGLEGGARANPAPERQDVGLCEDEDVRRLLLGFESIGQDCEFGLVQRRYGAEPLGLFRWNATAPDLLCGALDSGLAGVGDPACTLMSLWDDHEYYLADRRWGFAFHTWISRHEVDRDALFAKMCRRIAFLRDKLLSDLAGGDKVVVLKTFASSLEDVQALLGSLRAHGPVDLLWVRARGHDARADDPPQGSVEALAPGLYAGHVRRFGNNNTGVWDIAFDDWVALCRSMAAIREAAGAGGREPRPAVQEGSAPPPEPRGELAQGLRPAPSA